MLLPLNNSIVFKNVFSNKEILTAFVKDITGLDLELDIIETEKSFSPSLGVDIKIDVFAEDTKNRVILEIQRVKYDYHYDRFLHYHMSGIMELQRTYREYTVGKTVYTIVVLTDIDKYEKDIITTFFNSVSTDGEVIEIYPHKMYFINPNYVNDHTPASVKQWLELILDSYKYSQHPKRHIGSVAVEKAAVMIEDDGSSPEQIRLIMESNEEENTRRYVREDALKEGKDIGIKEGKDIGIKEGKDIGIKEGKDIGIKEGKDIGIKEGLLQTAKKMKAIGMPIEMIIQSTGLTIQEIEGV